MISSALMPPGALYCSKSPYRQPFAQAGKPSLNFPSGQILPSRQTVLPGAQAVKFAAQNQTTLFDSPVAKEITTSLCDMVSKTIERSLLTIHASTREIEKLARRKAMPPKGQNTDEAIAKLRLKQAQSFLEMGIRLDAIAMFVQTFSQSLSTKDRHFVGTVTHEFKTPIAAIVGQAEMMNRPDNTEAQQARHFEILMAALNILRLKSATVSSYMLAAPNQNPTLYETMSDIHQIYAQMMVAQNVSLSTSPTLKRDEALALKTPGWFFIVLSNLVANAIRYSDPDEPQKTIALDIGQAKIKANHWGSGFPSKDQTMLVFKVTDNGLGIPADRMPDLNKAPDAEKMASGSGFGLPAMSQLLSSAGGRLVIQSATAGDATDTTPKGTTILCYIPWELVSIK